MRTLVFVHGGPGLTTTPEERWFGGYLKKAGIPALFWNEPSATRPHGPRFVEREAFANAVGTLSSAIGNIDDVVFVAHSFGVHYILALPNQLLARASRMVLVAPSLALKLVLRRMAEIAASDFEEQDPDKAARIRRLLQETERLFDEPMAEAAALALSDPRLLTHYWQNAALMNRFFEVWQSPGAGLDVNCLFAGLRDYSTRWTGDASHLPRLEVATTIVIGDADPSTDENAVRRVAEAIFSDVHWVRFKGSGHFPHLERSADFLQLLRGLTAS